MTGYEVERDWITQAGLRAVCIKLKGTGGKWRHRCGYVGVPADNPLHGKDYDEEPLAYMDVHGGLTYANGKDNYPVAGYEWWFGFDCAHAGDKNIDEYIPKKLYVGTYGIVRDEQFVINECEKLAEQLIALTKEVPNE